MADRIFFETQNDMASPDRLLKKLELSINNRGLFQSFRGSVNEVKEFIIKAGFEIIITTGKSGIISKTFFEGIPNTTVVWQPNRHCCPTLPEGNKAIVMVDDYMGSGEKARESLVYLKSIGLNHFGFASITGTEDYVKERLPYRDAKLEALNGGSVLMRKLFFPKIRDVNLHNFLKDMATLSHHYPSSEAVRDKFSEIFDRVTKIN